MGTSLVSAYILKDMLSDRFAEIACMDSNAANDLMNSYPEYRLAKDDASHRFWYLEAPKMLEEAAAIEADLAETLH